jgi:hypothetical protein
MEIFEFLSQNYSPAVPQILVANFQNYGSENDNGTMNQKKRWPITTLLQSIVHTD